MSKLQVGRNGGVTGGLDLPGHDGLLEVRVYGWSASTASTIHYRHGRGDNEFRNLRTLFAGGSIACIAKVTLDGKPLPETWEGIFTSLVVQVGTDKTITYPVFIQSAKLASSQKENDLPDATFACDITGRPTLDGWDAGTEPDELTKSDQQQWGGTSFTMDAKGLQGASTVYIDWYDGAVGDGDTEEIDKLVAVIGTAVAPYVGLKLRTYTITRNAVDGGVITTQWGLTDTAEDVTNPLTVIDVDPDKVGTHSTTAAINNSTPTIPTVSGQTLVERNTSKRELNDGNILYVREAGQRSTVEDTTMEDTVAKIDALGIDSEGQTTQVFPHAGPDPGDADAPDASLKVVASIVKEMNRDLKKRVTFFDVNSSVEKIIFGRARAVDDEGLLKGIEIKGAVYVNGFQPGAPTVDGLTLVNTEVIPVVSPDTSNLSVVFWLFGEASSAEEEVFRRQRVITDANGLDGENVKAEIYDTGSNPSPPGASGLVLDSKESATLTSPNASNQSITSFTYKETNSADRAIFPRTRNITDPNGIRSEKTGAALFTTGSPPDDPSLPSGLKLVDKADIPLTNASASNLSIRVYRWGKLDSLDELRVPRQRTTIDPNGIDDRAARTKEWLTNASAPTAPTDTPTNNVKAINHTDLEVYPAIGSTPGLNLREFEYGARDSKDELVLPHVEDVVDPSGLEDRSSRAALDSDSITDPDDLVEYTETTRPVTSGLGTDHTLKTKEYRWMSPADELVAAHTRGLVDPITLFRQDVPTIIDSTDSIGDIISALYDANAGDTTFGGATVIPTKNPGKKLQIIQIVNDDKVVEAEIECHKEYLGNVGTVIRAVQVIQQGTNGCKVTLASIPFYRCTGRIKVRRRKLVTTDISEDVLQSALFNTRNDGDLLGFGEGRLIYAGADYRYLGGLTSDRLLEITYFLQFDSLSFQDEIPSGEYYSPETGLTAGYMNLSDLGLGLSVTYPDLGDLSFIWD